MGDPKPMRFALLCHQRSGSNALSAILNADPRVALYGQLFNHFLGYRRRNRRQLGMRGYRAHPEAMRHFGLRPPARPRLERALLSLAPVEASLERFMDTFWSRYHPAPDERRVVGFKLHDFQVSDEDLAALGQRHVDGVVMLWRRNLLKAAVSWAYAIRTDVWTRKQAASEAPPTFRLDPREIAWFIDKTAGEVERWRGVLRSAGANLIELTYEDDVRTRELEPLYRFLGLDWEGPPEFRTHKLAASGYAHVANAAELERSLGSDATGRLFERE